MLVAQGRYGALLFHFLTVPCLRGVPFTSLCSNPPCSARTLVSSNPPPPFALVSPGLSLCGSLSYSLPPILSCSPLLILYCCASLFLSHRALPSLSLTLCLFPSLPRPKKGGSGCLVHLYPPRGSNHPPRDRRGAVYPLGHDDGLFAPWHHGTMATCASLFFSLLSPPVMHIFFRMGVCSAVCKGTAQRPRVPGPLA